MGFELNQNKETDRKSKFSPQEKMKAINILSQQKKKLEEEYGPINIDLQTGEYTIVEVEDKK